MQEVFTRAWRHAEAYDPTRGSVRTWLYQIARHAIIDTRRRAAVRPALALHEPRDEEDPEGLSIERAMLGWQVAGALEKLTPEHRQVIRLAHVQGLSVREIAERLGLPEGTVKSRTWYALRSLRLVLEEMGVRHDARPRGPRRPTSSAASSPTRPRRVRAHLAECPECAAEHAELAGLPRCSTSRSVAGSASDGAARRPRSRSACSTASRASAPAAAGADAPLAPADRVGAPAARWSARPIAVRAAGGRPRLSRRTPAARRASTRSRSRPAPAPRRRRPRTPRCGPRQGGTVVRLWVEQPAGGPGDVYEVLLRRARTGAPSAGTFRVDAQGNAYVILTTAAQDGPVRRDPRRAPRSDRRADPDVDILRREAAPEPKALRDPLV